MTTETPNLKLVYPTGGDPVNAGNEVIKGLALALDSVGDHPGVERQGQPLDHVVARVHRVGAGRVHQLQVRGLGGHTGEILHLLYSATSVQVTSGSTWSQVWPGGTAFQLPGGRLVRCIDW